MSKYLTLIGRSSRVCIPRTYSDAHKFNWWSDEDAAIKGQNFRLIRQRWSEQHCVLVFKKYMISFSHLITSHMFPLYWGWTASSLTNSIPGFLSYSVSKVWFCHNSLDVLSLTALTERIYNSMWHKHSTYNIWLYNSYWKFIFIHVNAKLEQPCILGMSQRRIKPAFSNQGCVCK